MADDFSPQIAALTSGVPIVLLPVRIETRWFNSGNELRIRIFPDQIHADAHEPELTAAERDAGMVYWKAVFASPDPKKRKTTPWADLCAIVGAPRTTCSSADTPAPSGWVPFETCGSWFGSPSRTMDAVQPPTATTFASES